MYHCVSMIFPLLVMGVFFILPTFRCHVAAVISIWPLIFELYWCPLIIESSWYTYIHRYIHTCIHTYIHTYTYMIPMNWDNHPPYHPDLWPHDTPRSVPSTRVDSFPRPLDARRNMGPVRYDRGIRSVSEPNLSTYWVSGLQNIYICIYIYTTN